MTPDRIELLIIVVAAVALLVQRLRLPYTVGLMLAGFGLGVMPGNESLHLTKELVFMFLLPPLVFEAALNLRLPELQKDLVFIGTMATLGLVVSAAIVATGAVVFLGWTPQVSVLFAVLISATDPVSVIAMFKEAKKRSRIRLLLEAESLLNDGTAAVAFTLASAVAMGGDASPIHALGQFTYSAFGGVWAGILTGWGGLILVGRTDDPMVEIAITVATAYGSFLLAQHFGMSGVLATVAAGIVAGTYGSKGHFTERGIEATDNFWEFSAFAANSVIFLLIGARVVHIPLAQYGFPILIGVMLVLAGRAASVYGIGAAFSKTSWKVDLAGQHLLFWGGLRGALALALVLGIPESTRHATGVTAVTFGIVAFSVIVQGITMKPLVAKTV